MCLAKIPFARTDIASRFVRLAGAVTFTKGWTNSGLELATPNSSFLWERSSLVDFVPLLEETIPEASQHRR